MLFNPAGPRALRTLLIVFLIAMHFPVAAVAGGDLLELWFEYDGRPASLHAEPEVSCYRLPGKQPQACRLFRSDDGRYWLSRPPSGRYLLQIGVDQNLGNPPGHPGDLQRDYRFRVGPSTSGPLLISLRKRLTLQRPVSNNGTVPGQGERCDKRPDFSADILALFPTVKINFAWQPLTPDARYHYKLWRVRCADGMRLEQLLYHQTDKHRISEAIPPSEPGQYYQFELSAVSDNQTIGRLMLQGDGGVQVGEYRFVVHDPLIDRSWFYYALAVLLALFMLWVLIGALRSRPAAKSDAAAQDIRRPRRWRPAVLLLLLGLGAAAGYWQRGQLMPWLQRQGEVLLQLSESSWRQWQGGTTAPGKSSPTRDKAPVSVTMTARGEWRGVIVSASSQPFVGDERRAELRLRFVSSGVWVEVLRAGQWQRVGARPFRRQASGEGMTLFGHRRGDGFTELWSISIPQTVGKEWRISLDRIITRRADDGRVLSSGRRRAGGELRPYAP